MAEWGGWWLLASFAGILVWEEVWDLPNTAYLSGWLLLVITGEEAGSVAGYTVDIKMLFVCGPLGIRKSTIWLGAVYSSSCAI